MTLASLRAWLLGTTTFREAWNACLGPRLRRPPEQHAETEQQRLRRVERSGR